MADLALTPANVLFSARAVYDTGLAGAALTAGQPLYRDASDLDAYGRGKLKLADANLSAEAAQVVGIAANNAAAGQPVKFAVSDPEATHGLTGVAAGDIIVLSGTAGGLAPVADLASGMYPVILYVASSATKAVLSLVNGPAPVPA